MSDSRFACCGCNLLSVTLSLVLYGCGHPIPALPTIRLDGSAAAIQAQILEAQKLAFSQPQNAGASGNFGMVLHAYELHEEAALCYRRAALLDSQNHRWAYYLGLTLTTTGDHQEAGRWLQRAAGLNASYIPGQIALAQARLNAGDAAAARQIARECIRQDSRSAGAYLVLGSALSKEGDFLQAAVELRRALDLAPGLAPAHYALALAERALGNHEEAKRELALHEKHRRDGAQQDDPLLDSVRSLNFSPAAISRRAAALINQGRFFEAIQQYQLAIRTDSTHEPSYAAMIALYGRLRMFTNAVEVYRQAVEVSENFYDVHFNYAVVNLDNQHFPEAEEAFRKVLAHDPAHVEAHIQYGRLLEMTSRSNDAGKHYRLAVEKSPDHRQGCFLLGRWLATSRRPAEAIPFMECAARSQDEQAGWYLRALAGVYARDRRKDAAIEAALRALRLAEAQQQPDLVRALTADLQVLHRGGIPR